MTDDLSLLLRREADALDVPPAPTAAILAGTRRTRRRRAGGRSLLAVTIAAAAVTAVALAPRLAGGDASRELPVAASDRLDGWAVASGHEVQLGSGRTVDVGASVKSVYYTSAGVLVRTGDSAATDAPDSTYRLIGDDGELGSFALDLGDRVPGTDPASPYLAYADATGSPDRWAIVLVDVRTGEVGATTEVDGAFTWGGWVAPPVALSDGLVYVGLDDATLAVDPFAGTVGPTSLPGSTAPTVSGGREVVGETDEPSTVVDVASGAELLTIDIGQAHSSLSPDGRYAIAIPWRTCDEDDRCTYDEPSTRVYDVTTGNSVEIPLTGYAYGWTPGGDLLRRSDGSVDVCSAATGECSSTPIDVDDAHVRLGGSSYES
jgi:hypothetical protein